MKVQICELEGEALRWAIAKVAGCALHKNGMLGGYVHPGWWVSWPRPANPNDWQRLAVPFPGVGEIINDLMEKHHVSTCYMEGDKLWWACVGDPFLDETIGWEGETRAKAGLRALLVAKLGDAEMGTIEVPDDLV